MPVLVVQMGHVPRTTGATGTQGGGVTEQQYARWVAAACSRLLTRGGWVVRPIVADPPPAHYRGDAFVAVHCNGGAPSAHGASVGHQGPEGAALAARWKTAYAARGWRRGFERDNNTPNLAGYYGVREAIAQGNRRAVIVECGYLTNDEDRVDLVGDGVDRVALAIGDALGIPMEEEDNMYGEEQNQRDWATAYRLNNALQARIEIPDGPIAGEPLPMVTEWHAAAWRLHRLLQLDPSLASGVPGVDGESLPLVDLLEQVAADVAELKARPVADVDEAVLAAELEARGISGVTAAELKEILTSIRLVPAQSEGGTV